MEQDKIRRLAYAFMDALEKERTPSTFPDIHVLVNELLRESLEQTNDDARIVKRVLESLDELYARAVAGGASGYVATDDKMFCVGAYAREVAPIVRSIINTEKEAKQ